MSRALFNPVKPRVYDTPKQAVAELIEQRGGAKNVAVLLGYRSLSPIYEFTDSNYDKELTVAQGAALTTPGAPALAEYFAHRAGGVFLPIPTNGEPIAELTADAVRQAGQAAAELVMRLPNGLSAAEAAEVKPAIHAALRMFAQLRASIDAASKGTELK